MHGGNIYLSIAYYPIRDKSLYRRYNSKCKYLLLLKLYWVKRAVFKYISNIILSIFYFQKFCSKSYFHGTFPDFTHTLKNLYKTTLFISLHFLSRGPGLSIIRCKEIRMDLERSALIRTVDIILSVMTDSHQYPLNLCLCKENWLSFFPIWNLII